MFSFFVKYMLVESRLRPVPSFRPWLPCVSASVAGLRGLGCGAIQALRLERLPLQFGRSAKIRRFEGLCK